MDNRVAIVTGVSRRGGIGFATARRLAEMGLNLVLAHYRPHDEDQPWGPDDVRATVEEIRACAVRRRQRVVDIEADLGDAEGATTVADFARLEFSHVDVLVANHTLSGSDGPLGRVTAAMLDRHWAVNARSSILLAQEVALAHDGRPGGRIVFLTSGQDLGPMPGEICYAASKAALAGITKTIAHELAPRGITVNAVDPGPVDTASYVTDDLRAALADRFPFGRWGEPDDPARLIAWLVSEDGRWVTGQVLNTEGGFRRG